MSVLLKWKPKSVRAYACRNYEDLLPLHVAARYNRRAEVIVVLCEAYPKALRLCNSSYFTPLHYAASYNSNVDVVKAVMIAYPKALKCIANGLVPLEAAVKYRNNVGVVKVLRDACPDALRTVYGCRSGDRRLLFTAARHCNDVETVTLLMETCLCASVRSGDNGPYPLHATIQSRRSVPIVRALLGAQRNSLWAPFIRNDISIVALHLAAEVGSMDIVELLLEHGALVDQGDSHDQTALHYAVRCKHVDIVQLLLRRGACAYYEDSRGNTPLMLSADYVPINCILRRVRM